MLKKNKWMLIITSTIILIPVISGLILWNSLPEKIPTHWDINGDVDGWSNKAFAVFILPLFLFAVHWFCTLITAFVTKIEDLEGKLIVMVLWICPLLSLLCGSFCYATALGYDVNVNLIMPMVIGVMFVVIGNYLPKVKRNYVLGIKLPWTVYSDDNWYHTHRIGGTVWVIGGVIILATTFLENFVILLIVLILMALIPTVYSFVYYLKNEIK